MVTPEGIMNDVRLVQPLNEDEPIVVTVEGRLNELGGILNELNDEFPENALFAICTILESFEK